MDYKNQASLLRVIQEKYVVRLGSHDIIPVDVRIIAATNNNLKNLVQENKFRADLYFRLNVLNLLLPPLKARKGDILTFIKLFINTSQSKFKDKYVLHKEAVELLNNYSWPGNVRELINITERILATSTSPIITKEFLQGIIDPEYMSTSKDANKSKDNYSIKEQMQINEIVKALKSTKGNLSKAALLLGINRSTLWRRMNKYKLN